MTLTYWFSTDRLVREDVFLRCAFPPTPEQRALFTSDVSTKIDVMMEWLKVG